MFGSFYNKASDPLAGARPCKIEILVKKQSKLVVKLNFVVSKKNVSFENEIFYFFSFIPDN
jgi:hypothetical protein